jgi:chromosome segregation ATPase
MLQRVELSYFKNHCNTVVDFNSPFNVVVGRNGSGKSAVLDAIEWCLFHSKGKDIRALSHKDLVNKSKPPHEVMSVQIELLDVNNKYVNKTSYCCLKTNNKADIYIYHIYILLIHLPLL